MKETIKRNTLISCLDIFFILIVVHGFEAIILRMDETVFGENFINKVFGIVVLFTITHILNWSGENIGFSKIGVLKNILLGFGLGAIAFSISYAIEIMILRQQTSSISLGFFITSFSLTGEPTVNTGIGFILLCIFFNIINVTMEEGTFRGLFFSLVNSDHSMKVALLFQAILFGVWHIVTPLHNLIDEDINVQTFIILSIGYIILAGIMGIKWGLLKDITGSLHSGMADHFFNNCIATNLLHVVTDTGTDEMMIVRVLLAQIISFIIVLILWMRKKKYEDKRRSS